jgi:hypothetical protein
VGRAVIADVARTAENNGNAMKKVARLVSSGRRGGMAAVILSANTRP